MINAAELRASDDELIAITLQTTEGRVTAEAPTIWFRQRMREDDRGLGGIRLAVLLVEFRSFLEPARRLQPRGSPMRPGRASPR